MEGELEGGQSKKGEGGNDAVIGGGTGGGTMLAGLDVRLFPPNNNVIMTQAHVLLPQQQCCHDGQGSRGKESAMEL
jgi:hypothetical protein